MRRAALKLLGTVAIPPKLYDEFEAIVNRWGGGDVDKLAEAFVSAYSHEILSTPRFRLGHASKVFALAEALEAQLDAHAYPYSIVREFRVELALCRSRCAYFLIVRRVDRRTEYRYATLRRRGIRASIAAMRGDADVKFDVVSLSEPPFYVADALIINKPLMSYEAPRKHRRDVYEAWRDLRSRGLLVLASQPPIDLYVYDGELLAVTVKHPSRSFMRAARKLGLKPAAYVSGELRRLE